VQSGKVTADEADGTIRVLDSPFAEGDTYSIDSYVPDPTARQMRLAPRRFPTHLLGYTAFQLPGAGGVGASAPGQTMPRGEQQRVLHSPYAQTYRLARRLAAGRPTTYDTVKAVEKYLQSGFQYSEKPPVRRYPLAAFLFRDKVGYCQQFSGAMALLLRMDGIPARVAGGFAPGAFDHVVKEYRVRDLDAHSWVEVWFSGIGWVPFDPTPSLSPASSQSSSLNAASAARGTSADHGATGVNKRLGADIVAGSGGGLGASGSGSKMWLFALAVVVLVPLALVILWLMAVVRRRPHFHGAAQGAVDELRAALRRLGYDYPARTTLAELERRLRVTAGPAAARYIGLLRDQRYARPGSAAEPTARDRRELRRALTEGGGPLAHLRGLRALPPHPRAG
jgi:transglutaminase-like putative cysteine protease